MRRVLPFLLVAGSALCGLVFHLEASILPRGGSSDPGDLRKAARTAMLDRDFRTAAALWEEVYRSEGLAVDRARAIRRKSLAQAAHLGNSVSQIKSLAGNPGKDLPLAGWRGRIRGRRALQGRRRSRIVPVAAMRWARGPVREMCKAPSRFVQYTPRRRRDTDILRRRRPRGALPRDPGTEAPSDARPGARTRD